MKHVKWSVRYVPLECKNKLLEVQKISGGLIGELLADAVDFWYQNLPEETVDESPAVDTSLAQVGQDIAQLKNDTASHPLGNNKL